MDYVKGRKSIGGMINSIGFSEQDCASIKFLFEYLENGLSEISFESKNDFCIVLEDKQRLSFQVKINQFTLKYVSGLLRNGGFEEKNVFIGSGYDDSFRNLLQYKSRYVEAKNGLLCGDKSALYAEMKKICDDNSIQVDLLLQCDFFVLESLGRETFAKSAIEEWARNKHIYVDVDALFYELTSLISNRFRTFGGHLRREQILETINKHRTSKISSFIPKAQRVSSVVESTSKIEMENYIDNLIIEYPMLEDKLLLVKSYMGNEQLLEVKNAIEKIINMCPKLESILLVVLNMLGDYDVIIARKKLNVIEADSVVEYAKAHLYKKEFKESKECLELLDKGEWDSVCFYLSAVNNHELGNTDKAIEELKKCIELNNRFVDAYVFLASLIYVSDTETATDYVDIALNLDPRHAKAYLLRANISQLFDDFSAVIENCEKYIEYGEDDENVSILLMLAINKLHIEAIDWQIAFIKWNEVFRRERNIVGEVRIPIIDLGREYAYFFEIQSLEDGLTVLLNKQELFSHRKAKSKARTAIGLYAPQIDRNISQFVLQNVENPIRKSKKTVFDNIALPTIFKIYEDLEAYEYALENLLLQGVLHLNHDFGEHTKEYVICSDDITVEMQVVGSKLTGDAIIGQLDFKLEINPLSNSLDRFVEQLNKNCGYNEAAIILVFGEQYQTQLTFPKEKMKLTIIK